MKFTLGSMSPSQVGEQYGPPPPGYTPVVYLTRREHSRPDRRDDRYFTAATPAEQISGAVVRNNADGSHHWAPIPPAMGRFSGSILALPEYLYGEYSLPAPAVLNNPDARADSIYGYGSGPQQVTQPSGQVVQTMHPVPSGYQVYADVSSRQLTQGMAAGGSGYYATVLISPGGEYYLWDKYTGTMRRKLTDSEKVALGINLPPQTSTGVPIPDTWSDPTPSGGGGSSGGGSSGGGSSGGGSSGGGSSGGGSSGGGSSGGPSTGYDIPPGFTLISDQHGGGWLTLRRDSDGTRWLFHPVMGVMEPDRPVTINDPIIRPPDIPSDYVPIMGDQGSVVFIPPTDTGTSSGGSVWPWVAGAAAIGFVLLGG